MLKFNFKKSRLNFMLDWQSAPVGDNNEDWLRHLAAATDEVGRTEAMEALEMTDDADIDMPEDNTNA